MIYTLTIAVKIVQHNLSASTGIITSITYHNSSLLQSSSLSPTLTLNLAPVHVDSQISVQLTNFNLSPWAVPGFSLPAEPPSAADAPPRCHASPQPEGRRRNQSSEVVTLNPSTLTRWLGRTNTQRTYDNKTQIQRQSQMLRIQDSGLTKERR